MGAAAVRGPGRARRICRSRRICTRCVRWRPIRGWTRCWSGIATRSRTPRASPSGRSPRNLRPRVAGTGKRGGGADPGGRDRGSHPLRRAAGMACAGAPDPGRGAAAVRACGRGRGGVSGGAAAQSRQRLVAVRTGAQPAGAGQTRRRAGDAQLPGGLGPVGPDAGLVEDVAARRRGRAIARPSPVAAQAASRAIASDSPRRTGLSQPGRGAKRSPYLACSALRRSSSTSAPVSRMVWIGPPRKGA